MRSTRVRSLPAGLACGAMRTPPPVAERSAIEMRRECGDVRARKERERDRKRYERVPVVFFFKKKKT